MTWSASRHPMIRPEFKRPAIESWAIVAMTVAVLPGIGATPAAADPFPPVSLSIRETFDLWGNVAGGVRRGTVALNKLQLSGSLHGDDVGLEGVTAHVQVFRTDGRSLSSRVGDIQTMSNIEAVPTFRLFESWVEKKFGEGHRELGIRAGLLDLNASFDSIQAASLFINSSHGIGPDLSRSGLDGPSIFPVSALGIQLSWLPSTRWTFRVAAFDGVAGQPARPKAFVSVRLAPSDGALMIAQADYHMSDSAKIEVGAWRYSHAIQSVSPLIAGQPHDQGFYTSIEGGLPGLRGWSGWLRVGVADRRAQVVSSYLGAGVNVQGLVPRRPDDHLGIAIARAGIGAPASAAFGLSRAETTIEASYQYKVRDTLALQPDIQWVSHPAGVAGARSALVLGLRAILTFSYPRHPAAIDPGDPTVPPDVPQPAEPAGNDHPAPQE